MIKFLIALASAGGFAGAANAISLIYGSIQDRSQEKIINLGQEETKIKEPKTNKAESGLEKNLKPEQKLQLIQKQKVSFEGKLVFTRKLESPGKGVAKPLIYKGQVFSNDEYVLEKEKWEKQNKKEGLEDEDNEEHIKIELSDKNLKKNKESFQNYLNVFNEKIKKSNKDNHLEKLKESLEKYKDKFTENFGEKTYQKLLKEIKKLNPQLKK